MEHIDANISNGAGGSKKKIGVYNILNPSEKANYEKVINNPDIVITDESAPSIDKAGRVIIVVKWEELE